MHKKRVVAAVYAQGHAEHDEQSCKGMNPVIDYHNISPLFVQRFVHNDGPDMGRFFIADFLFAYGLKAVSNTDVHVCVVLKSAPEGIFMLTPEQVTAAIQPPVIVELVAESWSGVTVIIRG